MLSLDIIRQDKQFINILFSFSLHCLFFIVLNSLHHSYKKKVVKYKIIKYNFGLTTRSLYFCF